MSVFSEYIKNTMQQKQPQQPYVAGTVQPQQTVTPQPQQPVVDPNNAIGSLAELLGPTPAEREAQERRMLESKSKMQMWTGLFDGMRQLGNLYYTTKGATPQQYTDNPVAQVDQQYQQYRALNDSMANYRRNYAQSLYSLQRQMEQDKMAKEKHQATLDYYSNRDELARQKAELDKLKAARVIKQTDGSLVKFDPITGTTELLTEADPLYVEYKKSQINKNNRTGLGGGRGGGGRSNGTYGYRTTKHIDPVTGDVITERVPTTGNQPTQTPKKKKQASATNKTGFFNK